MRDAVSLATDVVVPDDGAAHPVLLIRTPYGRTPTTAGEGAIEMARRGWAVVVQDVRGRFDSEGTFDPFTQEIDDGYDAIAWAASQPWSSGKVAMWGGSYVGATQMLAAMSGAPALAAISPWITSGDYLTQWMYEGGALRQGFVQSWANGFGGDNKSKRELAKAWRFAGDPHALYQLGLNDPTLSRIFPPYGRWLDPTDKRYWSRIDPSRHYKKMKVAGLHVGGWYDIFCEGSIANYLGLVAAAHRPQRLIVGPWSHTNLFQHQGAHIDFGLAANSELAGLRWEILDWLRGAIDDPQVETGAVQTGAGTGPVRTGAVETGARIFFMGSNEWVELDAWPPPSKPLQLFLDNDAAGGVLIDGPPVSAERRTFRHDPANPVPTMGGRGLEPVLPHPGAMDQRSVESRPDVCSYTSSPLTEPLKVAGEVTARIWFATSGASADVCAKLIDVHPDGPAINIVDSVKRSKFTPGRARAVDVTLGSTAHVFLAGHSIRVDIASSNFPRLDRNPSTGQDPWTTDELRPADQTIHTGPRSASSITLPVM